MFELPELTTIARQMNVVLKDKTVREGRLGNTRLYETVVGVVRDVIAAGGRDDEVDLLGEPGSYRRLMSAKSVGAPCPRCGATIQKLQYMGGACYVCPGCQR
jgi:formamidopyrimidine-DNA glycosylase